MLKLEELVARHGRQIACICDSYNITFQALLERSSDLQKTLERQNVPPGPLAFVAHSDLATFVLVHSLWSGGRTALPLNPRLTRKEQERLIAMAGATLLEHSEGGWSVAQTAPNGPHPSSEERDASPTPAQVLIATSGSTGAPKLVSLSRRALECSACTSAERLAMSESDRWLLSLNLAHIGGYSIVTRCLQRGAAVVLAPGMPGAEQMASIIERHRVTLLSLVPTQLKRLLGLPPSRALASLRAILVGGAPCPEPLFREARDRGLPVLLTYGMSEAGAQVTTQPLSDLAQASETSAPSFDSGLPLDGLEMRLVGERVWLRGPALFDGYLAEAGTTLDRSDFDSNGWFRTGDAGQFTASGRFLALGRLGSQIVTGGEKVWPLEVEAALLACPSVAAAAVVAAPDPEWGNAVAAAVVPSGERPRDVNAWFVELTAALRQQLAPYKCPKRWKCLVELPTLPSGKLDRAGILGLFDPKPNCPQ